MVSSQTRLSDYFTVADLSPTSTGIPNNPTEKELPSLKKLASVLDNLQRKIGPFRIASGYRAPLVNAAVGGSSTSRHMKGEAVDIVPTTKSAEKYWAQILADSQLRNSLGEISYKKPQNSIHLSLPFTNSYGYRVIASPRVAEGSPMVYKTITSSQVENYLSKYNLSSQKVPITASVTGGIERVVSLASKTSFGKAMLALGAGVFALTLVMRKKK